jgi:hypothetical protein
MSLPQPVPLTYAPAPRHHQQRPMVRPRQDPKQVAAQAHRALGWEMTLRLGINLGLSLVALVALVRLVPHHQDQRQALVEIESAVAATTIKADALQAEFGRYFDPVEASRLLQVQSGTDSSQSISVVLVNPQDGTSPPGGQ